MAFFWCFLETIMYLVSTSLFLAVFSVIFAVCAVCWTSAIALDFTRR